MTNMKGEAYYMVFLCGLADAISTWLGLKFGYAETNPLFAPFLATLVFFAVLIFFDWKKLDVSEGFREILRAVLVLVALSPVLNNLAVLLGVNVFSLFG
jgi:hypothetical protein